MHIEGFRESFLAGGMTYNPMTGAVSGTWPTQFSGVDIVAVREAYEAVALFEENFMRRFLHADDIPLYEWQMHEQREELMSRLWDVYHGEFREAA